MKYMVKCEHMHAYMSELFQTFDALMLSFLMSCACFARIGGQSVRFRPDVFEHKISDNDFGVEGHAMAS